VASTDDIRVLWPAISEMGWVRLGKSGVLLQFCSRFLWTGFEIFLQYQGINTVRIITRASMDQAVTVTFVE
jgi:hypothetical protein